MENYSHIDRFVDKKEDTLEKLEEATFSKREAFLSIESEDITEKEKLIIKSSIRSVEELAESYGGDVERKIIDKEQIIVTNPGVVSGSELLGGSRGVYLPLYGVVLAEKMKSEPKFFEVITHELLHHYSYRAMQNRLAANPWKTFRDKVLGPKIAMYRSGITVSSRDDTMKYFSELEEGIVGALTQKCLHKLRRKSIVNFDDDYKFSRSTEQIVLINIAKSIYEESQGDLGSVQSVLELFFRAHFTGRILELARVVEDAFGEGSFRELGELTGTKNSEKYRNDIVQMTKKLQGLLFNKK